jgi:hypothetical protein
MIINPDGSQLFIQTFDTIKKVSCKLDDLLSIRNEGSYTQEQYDTMIETKNYLSKMFEKAVDIEYPDSWSDFHITIMNAFTQQVDQKFHLLDCRLGNIKNFII